MLKGQNDDNLYFSTKVELKINGMIFRPSICYKVPPLAKKSLEKFSPDKVTFYTSPVRFVNGALAPVLSEQASSGVASVVREVEATKTAKKKSR